MWEEAAVTSVAAITSCYITVSFYRLTVPRVGTDWQNDEFTTNQMDLVYVRFKLNHVGSTLGVNLISKENTV